MLRDIERSAFDAALPGLRFVNRYVKKCEAPGIKNVPKSRNAGSQQLPVDFMERFLLNFYYNDDGLSLASKGALHDAADRFASSIHLMLHPYLDGVQDQKWKQMLTRNSEAAITLRSQLGNMLLDFGRAYSTIGSELKSIRELDLAFMSIDSGITLLHQIHQYQCANNPSQCDGTESDSTTRGKPHQVLMEESVRYLEGTIANIANFIVNVDREQALENLKLYNISESSDIFHDRSEKFAINYLKIILEQLQMPIEIISSHDGSIALRTNLSHFDEDEKQMLDIDARLLDALVKADVVSLLAAPTDGIVQFQAPIECKDQIMGVRIGHKCQGWVKGEWKLAMNSPSQLFNGISMVEKSYHARAALYWLDHVVHKLGFCQGSHDGCQGSINTFRSPAQANVRNLLVNREKSHLRRWGHREGIGMTCEDEANVSKANSRTKEACSQNEEDCLDLQSIVIELLESSIEHIKAVKDELFMTAKVQFGTNLPVFDIFPSLFNASSEQDNTGSKQCNSKTIDKPRDTCQCTSSKSKGRLSFDLLNHRSRPLAEPKARIENPFLVPDEIVSTKDDFVAPMLITIAYFFVILCMGSAAAYAANYRKKQQNVKQRQIAASINRRADAVASLREAISESSIVKLTSALKAAQEAGAEKPLIKKARATLHNLKKRRIGAVANFGQQQQIRAVPDAPPPSIAKLLRDNICISSFSRDSSDYENEIWLTAGEKCRPMSQSISGSDVNNDANSQPHDDKHVASSFSKFHDEGLDKRSVTSEEWERTKQMEMLGEKRGVNLNASDYLTSKDRISRKPSKLPSKNASSKQSIGIAHSFSSQDSDKKISRAGSVAVCSELRKSNNHVAGKGSESGLKRTISAPPEIVSRGNDKTKLAKKTKVGGKIRGKVSVESTLGKVSDCSQSYVGKNGRQQKKKKTTKQSERDSPARVLRGPRISDIDGNLQFDPLTNTSKSWRPIQNQLTAEQSKTDIELDKSINPSAEFWHGNSDLIIAEFWGNGSFTAANNVNSELSEAYICSNSEGISKQFDTAAPYANMDNGSNPPTPQAYITRPTNQDYNVELKSSQILSDNAIKADFSFVDESFKSWRTVLHDWNPSGDEKLCGAHKASVEPNSSASNLSISTPSPVLSMEPGINSLSAGSSILIGSETVDDSLGRISGSNSDSIELLASLQHIWGSSSEHSNQCISRYESDESKSRKSENKSVATLSMCNVFGNSPFVSAHEHWGGVRRSSNSEASMSSVITCHASAPRDSSLDMEHNNPLTQNITKVCGQCHEQSEDSKIIEEKEQDDVHSGGSRTTNARKNSLAELGFLI